MKRICVLCGKEFESKSSRRLMCYDVHYHLCPICGTPVVITDLQHTNTCCCSKHSRMLATRTIKEKFPNNEHINNPVSKAKRRAKNIFLTPEGQAYAQQRVQKIYNVKCIFQLKEFQDKSKATCLEKYDAEYWIQSDIGKSTLKQIIRDKYNNQNLNSTLELPEVKEKCDSTNLKRYDCTNAMQNPDICRKQRACSKSKYIASDGTKLDSTYELDVYEFCIRNNVDISCNIKVPYVYQDSTHVTFIDFQIAGYLVEVKGEHILEGYFDDRGTPIDCKLHVYENNDVVVVTGVSKASIFGSVEYPNLKGIDIELFRYNEGVELSSIWPIMLTHIKHGSGFLSLSDVLSQM